MNPTILLPGFSCCIAPALAAVSLLLMPAVARADDGATPVKVHIDRVDKKLVLEGRPPRGSPRASALEPWSLRCPAPCDAEVMRDYEYRITGDGVRTSATFKLEGGPAGKTTLAVSPASKGAFTTGVAMASAAPVAFLGGAALLIHGFLQSWPDGNTPGSTALMETGGVIALSAAGGFVTGLFMLAFNASTSVAQDAPVPPPRRTEPSQPVPTWPRESSAGPYLPPIPTVAILTRSF
jgi:hypothetical protein